MEKNIRFFSFRRKSKYDRSKDVLEKIMDTQMFFMAELNETVDTTLFYLLN